MSRLASLEIHKEELSFSAGHFTIFSATEREHLHGHNYYVHAAFQISIEENGMAFDYRLYKKKILEICEHLDRRFLLPGQSPFLLIEETSDYIIAHFNQQKIPFLKNDVVIVPVCNITIEELSNWFLSKLIENKPELIKNGIQEIKINVYNGPGQSGGAVWTQ